jgi:hypothetical protein
MLCTGVVVTVMPIPTEDLLLLPPVEVSTTTATRAQKSPARARKEPEEPEEPEETEKVRPFERFYFASYERLIEKEIHAAYRGWAFLTNFEMTYDIPGSHVKDDTTLRERKKTLNEAVRRTFFASSGEFREEIDTSMITEGNEISVSELMCAVLVPDVYSRYWKDGMRESPTSNEMTPTDKVLLSSDVSQTAFPFNMELTNLMHQLQRTCRTSHTSRFDWKLALRRVFMIAEEMLLDPEGAYRDMQWKVFQDEFLLKDTSRMVYADPWSEIGPYSATSYAICKWAKDQEDNRDEESRKSFWRSLFNNPAAAFEKTQILEAAGEALIAIIDQKGAYWEKFGLPKVNDTLSAAPEFETNRREFQEAFERSGATVANYVSYVFYRFHAHCWLSRSWTLPRFVALSLSVPKEMLARTLAPTLYPRAWPKLAADAIEIGLAGILTYNQGSIQDWIDFTCKSALDATRNNTTSASMIEQTLAEACDTACVALESQDLYRKAATAFLVPYAVSRIFTKGCALALRKQTKHLQMPLQLGLTAGMMYLTVTQLQSSASQQGPIALVPSSTAHTKDASESQQQQQMKYVDKQHSPNKNSSVVARDLDAEWRYLTSMMAELQDENSEIHKLFCEDMMIRLLRSGNASCVGPYGEAMQEHYDRALHANAESMSFDVAHMLLTQMGRYVEEGSIVIEYEETEDAGQEKEIDVVASVGVFPIRRVKREEKEPPTVFRLKNRDNKLSPAIIIKKTINKNRATKGIRKTIKGSKDNQAFTQLAGTPVREIGEIDVDDYNQRRDDVLAAAAKQVPQTLMDGGLSATEALMLVADPTGKMYEHVKAVDTASSLKELVESTKELSKTIDLMQNVMIENNEQELQRVVEKAKQIAEYSEKLAEWGDDPKKVVVALYAQQLARCRELYDFAMPTRLSSESANRIQGMIMKILYPGPGQSALPVKQYVQELVALTEVGTEMNEDEMKQFSELARVQSQLAKDVGTLTNVGSNISDDMSDRVLVVLHSLLRSRRPIQEPRNPWLDPNMSKDQKRAFAYIAEQDAQALRKTMARVWCFLADLGTQSMNGTIFEPTLQEDIARVKTSIENHNVCSDVFIAELFAQIGMRSSRAGLDLAAVTFQERWLEENGLNTDSIKELTMEKINNELADKFQGGKPEQLAQAYITAFMRCICDQERNVWFLQESDCMLRLVYFSLDIFFAASPTLKALDARAADGTLSRSRFPPLLDACRYLLGEMPLARHYFKLPLFVRSRIGSLTKKAVTILLLQFGYEFTSQQFYGEIGRTFFNDEDYDVREGLTDWMLWFGRVEPRPFNRMIANDGVRMILRHDRIFNAAAYMTSPRTVASVATGAATAGVATAGVATAGVSATSSFISLLGRMRDAVGRGGNYANRGTGLLINKITQILRAQNERHEIIR